MEYIQNGNFEDGTLEHWTVVQAPVTVGQEDDRHHASFGADSKLNQHWRMDNKPSVLTLSLEIKVADGLSEPTGQVQAVLFAHGVGLPGIHTVNLPEYPEWRSYTVAFPMIHSEVTGTLELLVQPGFNNAVSIRNISVTGPVLS